MKNSIIYLGIALVSFTNANCLEVNHLTNNLEILNAKSFPKPALENENESNSTEDFLTVKKTMEEIIAEDNQIIESKIDKVVRPLNLEIPIENYIAEDNKIVESDFSNVVYPLDFDIINKKETLVLPTYNDEFRTH